ncbi:hypothetical protein [Polaromonas sp.]|uniref:hypothetical protein n=1 Tax=Polaromonas sp. TaxID=1869339 RepID=UPI0032670584
MKFNQSLTAAITAAALVAGAGFAYAQNTGTTPGAPGDLNSQRAAEMKAPDVNPATGTTMEAQPSTSTSGSSVDSTTSATPAPADTGTLEPRADRN